MPDMAPLLFSLALRSTLEQLQQALPNATIVAYLDDIYIFGRDQTDVVAVAAEIFSQSHTNLKLNIAKSDSTSVEELRRGGPQSTWIVCRTAR